MRSWFLLVVALSVFGTTSFQRVVAQEPADIQEYDALLAEAMRAYQAHEWPRACEQFERAYARYPNARALRGVGVAAFESGQFVRAVQALEGALVHPERPLPDELREPTQLLAAQARTRIAVYRIERSPGEAAIFLDDARAVFEADGTLLLEPGVHAIRLEANGFLSATRKLEARAGDATTLIVDLLPEPHVSEAPKIPRVEAVLDPPVVQLDRGAPSRLVRNAAFGAAGLAAAGVLSAGMLWWTGNHRLGAIDDHCDSRAEGCPDSEAKRRLNDAHLTRLERGIDASIAIAATMAVTASLLWTLEWFKKKPAGKRAALLLRGSF